MNSPQVSSISVCHCDSVFAFTLGATMWSLSAAHAVGFAVPRITCCLCRRAFTSSSTDESESDSTSSAVFMTSTNKPTPPVSLAMSSCCAGSLVKSSFTFTFIALRSTLVLTAC